MSPLVRKRISNLQVGLCGHPACRIGAATCVQRDRNLELIVKSIDYGLMECLEGIRTPCKLLKRWSGRPDSNRRRPAWEIDSTLKIKNMAFMVLIARDIKPPIFNDLFHAVPYRNKNGTKSRTSPAYSCFGTGS